VVFCPLQNIGFLEGTHPIAAEFGTVVFCPLHYLSIYIHANHSCLQVLDTWVAIGREHVRCGKGSDDMAALARRLSAGAAPQRPLGAEAGRRPGGWLAPAWWGSSARELMRQWLAKRRPIVPGRSRL